jgi:hypothetical protein
MQNPLKPTPTGEESKPPTKEELEAKQAASRNPQAGRLRKIHPGRRGF